MNSQRLGTDDSALAGVITAILLLGAFVVFLGVLNVVWLPVFAQEDEAEHSLEVRNRFYNFAETFEGHLDRGLTDRPIVQTLPLGQKGTSIPFVGTAPTTTGRVITESTPAITVNLSANTLLNATGALSVRVEPSRYPGQTLRYAFGAIEHSQQTGTWVDLRGFLNAERSSGSSLSLTLRVTGISAGALDLGTAGQINLQATVTAASNATQLAGDVRVLATGVKADAWRAALNRTLGLSSLTGEMASDCSSSTRNYCFDSDTNDASTVDLLLRNARQGWNLVSGTVRLEVR